MVWFSNQLNYKAIFLLLYKGPTTPVLRLVWAFSVSLATTREIDYFLSFPLVTKMFQFTRLLSIQLCIYCMMLAHYHQRVAPLGNLRIKATYGSPKHIVVRHVLHHLLVPSHSSICPY